MVAHGSYVYEDLIARENRRSAEVMRGGAAAAGRIVATLAQVELEGVARAGPRDARARRGRDGLRGDRRAHLRGRPGGLT